MVERFIGKMVIVWKLDDGFCDWLGVGDEEFVGVYLISYEFGGDMLMVMGCC